MLRSGILWEKSGVPLRKGMYGCLPVWLSRKSWKQRVLDIPPWRPARVVKFTISYCHKHILLTPQTTQKTRRKVLVTLDLPEISSIYSQLQLIHPHPSSTPTTLKISQINLAYGDQHQVVCTIIDTNHIPPTSTAIVSTTPLEEAHLDWGLKLSSPRPFFEKKEKGRQSNFWVLGFPRLQNRP